MTPAMRMASAVAAVAMVSGCGAAGHRPAAPASTLPGYAHVVVVVEENHPAESIIGNPAAPFMNSLATGGALMTASYAVSHPSQPNYLALFAGDTFGVDSNACPLNLGDAPNLASKLLDAGYSFGGFAEGMPASEPAACTAGGYVRKHVPWLNFTNVPASASVPIDAFTGEGALPTVSFVVPDLNNDMHDGTVAAADAWLATHLAGYPEWAKANDSLLILTWDEDDSSADNRIATIFYGAGVTPGTYSQRIDHYNVLATIEEIYRLPKTGRTVGVALVGGIWSAS